MNKYDVIIAGGGTAGCACAYTAGKLGFKVLLVEKNSFLGGSITSSLVVPAMKTSDNAINTEFFNKLYSELEAVGGAITYIDGNKGWFNPELAKIILDKMMQDAHVDILFESNIRKIEEILSGYIVTIEGDNIMCGNQALLYPIETKYLVDATGDAKICQKLNCEFLEKNFIPYAITYNDNPNGKFTSYYEVMFRASKYRKTEFSYPIYGRPADLLEINLQDFDKSLPKKQLMGRLVGQKLVPYYTREEINKLGPRLRAQALLYVASPVDALIAQIQGSAIAQLDDGTYQRIGYAGNNGWPFKGIGSILLEHKELASNEMNMIRIKQWLNENSHKADKYMNENPRYVFHRLIKANGPIGAQGVALTAGRSLAVDTDYIPLGSLLWLETSYPDKGKLGKLVVAQDVGGAIKGPIRGDYFWGSGGDQVLQLAGSMNAAGRYYILVPNNAEVKVQ